MLKRWTPGALTERNGLRMHAEPPLYAVQPMTVGSASDVGHTTWVEYILEKPVEQRNTLRQIPSSTLQDSISLYSIRTRLTPFELIYSHVRTLAMLGAVY